jgi:hypothetical protein
MIEHGVFAEQIKTRVVVALRAECADRLHTM